MSAQPFLSIIIPVYNAEEYLPACLDSVLAQTFTDYEVIPPEEALRRGYPGSAG